MSHALAMFLRNDQQVLVISNPNYPFHGCLPIQSTEARVHKLVAHIWRSAIYNDWLNARNSNRPINILHPVIVHGLGLGPSIVLQGQRLVSWTKQNKQ